MSGPGEALKSVFEDTLLELKGVDVFIYQNWQSEQMTSIEARAVKERGKQHFEFPLGTRVKKDDVVQIKGSQDFWRIVDTEEEYKYGTAVKLHVRVTKIDEAGNVIRLNSEGRAVNYTTNIQGHNYGGIQQGGQGNTQNISLTHTSNADFDSALANIIKLIRSSSLSEEVKQDVEEDVFKINKLALKEPTPGLLEKAKSRLDMIKLGIQGTEVAIKAAPHIETVVEFLRRRFGD